MTRAGVYAPVLSPILRDRKFAFAISSIALLQLLLGFLRLQGLAVSFILRAGNPMSGCGLTRATLSLFHGDLKESIALHAFAPIFVIGLALVTCSAVAPRRQRQRIAVQMESLDGPRELPAFF